MEENYNKFYEYESACNPQLKKNSIYKTNINEFEDGIHFIDQGKTLGINNYKCTSADLLGGFIILKSMTEIEINNIENFNVDFNITSMIFYIYKGDLKLNIGYKKLNEEKYIYEGDICVVSNFDYLKIRKFNDSDEIKIFFVNDSPLLNYLNVKSMDQNLKLLNIYSKKSLYDNLNDLSDPKNNRKGILLGNDVTEKIGTKTISKTLWTLLNEVPINFNQNTHYHNSIAFDFIIEAEKNLAYTLVYDENENITKINWNSGDFFITPINLKHSHHNDSLTTKALVLPIQNTGLLTYLRSFNIELQKK